MAISAFLSSRTANSPWQKAIAKLGHDQAHRATALKVALGEEMGLSQSSIVQSSHDMLIVSGVAIDSQTKEVILEEFNRRATKEAKLYFLQMRINSQPDGSPGLKKFRQHIIEVLAKQLDGDDPGMEAVQKYQLNGGVGDFSDQSFNDLNIEAIEAALETEL
jgi:hypothetical protein